MLQETGKSPSKVRGRARCFRQEINKTIFFWGGDNDNVALEAFTSKAAVSRFFVGLSQYHSNPILRGFLQVLLNLVRFRPRGNLTWWLR